MNIEILKSKIHRIPVTQANMEYVGSITIDQDLMDKVNLIPNEKVDVLNISNGERLTTYVLKGKRGTNEICINGAAAHKVNVGDLVIIVSYASMELEEAKKFQPKVLVFDKGDSFEEQSPKKG